VFDLNPTTILLSVLLVVVVLFLVIYGLVRLERLVREALSKLWVRNMIKAYPYFTRAQTV